MLKQTSELKQTVMRCSTFLSCCCPIFHYHRYIFPAIGLAAASVKALRITDDDMLVAARTLAAQVKAALQGAFTRRVLALLPPLGKRAVLWDEALETGLPPGAVTVDVWRDWMKEPTERHARAALRVASCVAI